MFGVFKKSYKTDCKLGLKSATSFIELLIIFAIVGVLFVLYQKTVDKDAITTKYAYKNAINDVIAYAATETDTYRNNLPNPICENFFNAINTLGDKNCNISQVPVLPNLTTTSGMRFFGLHETFKPASDRDDGSFIMIDVDLDGLFGDNTMGKDIFTMELLQNGRIRPAGEAVLDASGRQLRIKGNIARDPQLYAVSAAYIPEGVTNKDDYQTMGNRLSYAEAQCLSGNIFPYRSRSNPYDIQMCIEDRTVRNAINAVRDAVGGATADQIAARDAAIKEYRKEQATNNTICSRLYTDDDSVASGLAKANNDVVQRCQKCYKAVYKAKYCAGVTTATTDCPQAVLNEKGSCMTPEYAEVTN